MYQLSTNCPKIEYYVCTAACLPFPDDFFDAAFHFGGINLFSDKRKAIQEMARVVREGGKIVIGDESLAPWLRESIYGKILMNSNNLYSDTSPIDLLPENARDVCLRWMIGNAYYAIDFRIEGSYPKIDLDLPILGRRGGTHRTRYYGVLEGVTIEAKELALKAAEHSNVSIHEWLDSAVRNQAKLSR